MRLEKVKKLNKVNKYAGALLISSTILLYILNNQSNDKVAEEIINTNPPTQEYIIKINEELPSELGIEDLGIKESNKKIGSSYKILRFANKDNYYKVMFVITYVDYDENMEEVYTICDAFSKNELFKVTLVDGEFDFENIYDEDVLFSNSKIIGYDELSNISKYIEWDGIEEETLSNIIPNNIENIGLSEEELANIYLQLYPENFRISLEDYKISKTYKR